MTDADAERDAAVDNALEWERIALERKDLLDAWREDHARLYAAVDRHLAVLAEVVAELRSMSAVHGSAPDMRDRALALARRVEAESEALRRRTERR